MWEPRQLLAIGCVLVSGVSAAQDPPYGYAEQVAQNVTVHAQASIAGVEDDGWPISGTNVVLTNAAGAFDNLANSTYDDAQFYKVVIEFDGVQVYEKEYEVGGGGSSFGCPVGQTYAQAHQPADIRFASTHYDHLEDVTIEVTCFFALFSNGEQVSTAWVTATIEPTVYNRVALWKTSYKSDGSVWTSPASTYINEVMIDGNGGFVTAAKYGREDGYDDSRSVASAEMDASTALFAVTHGHIPGQGEYGNLAHALGHSITTQDHWFTWSEISALVADADPMPLYSWVILYACELGLAQSNLRSSFQMRSEDGVFLGFGDEVWPFALRLSDSTVVALNNHSGLLFDKLSEGYSASQSLTAAQNQFVPLKGDQNTSPQISMNVYGDGLTTLQWLYLTSAERTAATGNKFANWIKIYEKE
jgi:hypothetical protein